MDADARILSLLLPLLLRFLVLVFVSAKMEMKTTPNSKKRRKSRRLYPPEQTLFRRGRRYGM